MPVEVGIWRVGEGVERVHTTPMPDEAKLEDILATDLSIIDPRLLLIGRQVPTGHGGYIDLLAMDPDGHLVILELKRDRTPRDVVAQALDYAAWVQDLMDDEIASIFDRFNARYYPERADVSLDRAFKEKFRLHELPEALNERHEVLIVAGSLDPSTERIVTYLADAYDAPINAVFFRFFRDGDREYLSRAWLIDPTAADLKSASKQGDRPWNGEYYVAFGHDSERRWEDALRYGYIAAGGGARYSNALYQLELGARIWVHIPSQGYVGVARVRSSVEPITTFAVRDEAGTERPITEVVENLPSPNVDEELLEHFVRVEWLETRGRHESVWEKGFFANQNVVARPRDSKWAHTIERLRRLFNISADPSPAPTPTSTHVDEPPGPA